MRRALLEEHRDEVLERIAGLQSDLAAVTYKITNYEQLAHILAHRHSDT
jgi:hypothetical protein